MAVPPLPTGTTPLAGLTTVDLSGSSLTQWASHVQDVASGMILPPEMAVTCPQADIVGVLNCLENLTPVKYYRFCFGVGRKCRCSNVPHQTPSPASGLWTPPTMSYPAMASPTETMASSSVGGVPPLRHPPLGLPPVDPAMMSYSAMASLPEAAASSSANRVPPLRHPPPGPPPGNQAPMDTPRPSLLKTCWPLPVSAEVVGVGDPQQWGPGHQPPLAPDRHNRHPPSSRCLPQEGRRQARQPLTSSKCIRHNILLGYGWSPPK